MMSILKSSEPFVDLIGQHRIIGILRHLDNDQLLPVFESLTTGGIRLIEVTMNTEGAASQIKLAHENFADKVLIGAGTVTDIERAKQAIQAGAQFLVTPNLDLAVMDIARQAKIPIIPGVMTPTEMMAAYQAGAAALKLFPARQLGLAYVKDILSPLDQLKLVAVGGITLDNASEWIRAGCIGVGIGNNLIDQDLIRARNYQGLFQLASAFVKRLG